MPAVLTYGFGEDGERPQCSQCGAEYLPAYPAAKYCSKACGVEAKREASRRPRESWGKVTMDCEYCGKTFETFKSELCRNRRFCSRQCFFDSEPPSPALLPGVADKISKAKTTHGRSTGKRRRQLENAGFSLAAKGETCCRNCGRSDLQPLHMHHAIPRSMWKAGICEPLNGIPLCPSCHRRWHSRTLTIYRDVFTPEEWACISTAPLLGQNVTAWLDERYPARQPVERTENAA